MGWKLIDFEVSDRFQNFVLSFYFFRRSFAVDFAGFVFEKSNNTDEREMMDIKIVDSKEVEGAVCSDVSADEVDVIVKEVIPEMSKILFEMNGAGLAAPQVGIKKKFFIIRNDKNAFVFFNARYAKDSDGKVTNEEGCLSYDAGKKHIPIKRFKKVLVMWDEWDGKAFIRRSQKFNGMTAVVFQHEIDHINGTTIFTRR